MENNPFELQFKEISTEALIESLSKRNGYQPSAQKAIVNEAIFRKIIENETDEAIFEAIAKFQIENPKIQVNTLSNKINWDKLICYSFSTLFLLGGILMIFNILKEPLISIIISIFFFFLSYYLFRLPNRKSKKKNEFIQYNRPGEKRWIIAGYIFSVLGGLIGFIISLDFYLSGKKGIGQIKIYEYDDKTRRHGLNMIIINILIIVIWRILKN